MSRTWKLTSLEQRVEIPAPPEAVYQALSDPSLHAAVIGAEVTGEAVVGGEFTAWDGYIEGRFLELDPGRRIVQEWWTTEWPEGCPPSKVEFALLPIGVGKTEIRFLHSNVPADQAESYRQGWIDYYWTPLQVYFSKG